MQRIVHDARDSAATSGEPLTSTSLAKKLKELGYEVCVRSALGGGNGLECLHNLRHDFLVVCPPSHEVIAKFYIIDIDFQAQFHVAHPTKHYQALIENMEGEFIGTEQKLRCVIQMLCEEMAQAFREQDIGLPPWRQSASMLSKWCPRRSEDWMPDGARFPSDAAGAQRPQLDLQRSASWLESVDAVGIAAAGLSN